MIVILIGAICATFEGNTKCLSSNPQIFFTSVAVCEEYAALQSGSFRAQAKEIGGIVIYETADCKIVVGGGESA
jgi:hypothetical protein